MVLVMKRIEKTSTQQWQTLSYPKDKKRIINLLLREQGFLCAYTEVRVTATYAKDVEHFNPNLKETVEDGYENWFAVSHLWNQKKGTKWDGLQPMLHPTDEDLESRIKYKEGNYFYLPDDIAARNLIELVGLDNDELIKERSRYAKKLKKLLRKLGGKEELLEYLLEFPEEICFRRVLEAELGFHFTIEDLQPKG